MMTQEKNESQEWSRYYALDALRVIAFGVLIFYHIGMYYVLEWGWHIKSPTQFAWLQDIMILSNQWRMSLLFLISSMVLVATYTKMLKHGSVFNAQYRLIGSRVFRLFLPLVFGMYVIVSPQVYIEWTANGTIDASFGEFYRNYINPNSHWLAEKQSVIGLLTWNHLWFLPYLLVYSVVLLLMLPLLNTAANAMSPALRKFWLFNLTVIVITLVVWLNLRQLFPTTHDLLNDWYSHAKYGVVMLVGAVIMLSGDLWAKVTRCRRWYLCVAIFCYGLIILDRHDYLGPVGDWMTQSYSFRIFVGIIVVANHWAWLGAILGYGKRFLNQPNEFIQKLNKGIYCYYIMHQTLIVVFAYLLSQLALPIVGEFVLLVALTVLGCSLAYQIVKHVPFVRWCFGVFNSDRPKRA